MDLMLRVSQEGDWNSWIVFFLGIVENAALETLVKVETLWRLRADYKDKVQTRRASALVPKLIDGLFKSASLTIGRAARTLKVSNAQASEHVRRLERMGILREVTGGDRNLLFIADDIIKVIFD
jgi:Fic family protein